MQMHQFRLTCGQKAVARVVVMPTVAGYFEFGVRVMVLICGLRGGLKWYGVG